MLKRVTAFFMAFVAVFFIFVDCTPRTKAVAPIALVEAALASFVLTSGYKLWVDNGTGEDLLSLVSDAYGDFLQEHGNMALTLSSIASGGLIRLDNDGRFVLSSQVVQSFQAFGFWLRDKFNIGSVQVPIVQGDSSDYYDFSGVPCYKFEPSLTTVYNGTTFYIDPQIVGVYQNGQNMYLATTSQDDYYFYLYNDNNNNKFLCFLCLGQTFQRIAVFVGDSFSATATSGSFSNGSWIKMFGSNISSRFNWNNILPVSNAAPSSLPLAPTSGPSASTGLSASIATTLKDFISNLTSDDSLVLDVGASVAVPGENGVPADATAEEIEAATQVNVIDAVIEGYNSETGTLPVTDSIVSTVTIDTPVYGYPDFDDLGLPELGLALVERFPFCIPYDFVHLVTLFNADPVAPYIRIDLFPQSFRQRIGLSSEQAVFYLDMRQEQYQTMGVIIRWGTLVGFCVGLLFITRKLIWSS